MAEAVTIATGIVKQGWHVLNESSIYLLFGFLMAGLVKSFVSDRVVAGQLGSKGLGSVLKASLFGIPLPLCSCSVVPGALALRKQGASKGATAAFMISTPESGVDSMAITWALLDPIMTVVRPLAALVTATAGGMLVNLVPDREQAKPEAESTAAGPTTSDPITDEPTTTTGGCGCSSSCGIPAEPSFRTSFGRRLRSGLSFAFGDLVRDIGGWLLLGIGIAGLITFFLPQDFFHRYLDGEFKSLLIMLVLGIPLYVCATASTPIAAALVLKGLSPGAALVFLLAGPATNAATLAVMIRLFGKRACACYVAAISVCSVLFGWMVNRIYELGHVTIAFSGGSVHDPLAGGPTVAASVVVLMLVAANLVPKRWLRHSAARAVDDCSTG